MPINRKMMRNMRKEYGKKKGTRIYYATENKLTKMAKRNVG